MNQKSSPDNEPIRIDKWLWAARFYKTRSIAKSMVENGKVKYDGQRCKPSRNVELGAVLTIVQGLDEKQVTVLGLSETRKSAPEAQLMYQELAESIEQRLKQAELRKLQYTNNPHPDSKPDKKQRRQLLQVKQQNFKL